MAGVHFDEAVYGLQGQHIYEGRLPVFFQSYTGREPFHIYLVALVYLFTGPGTWGLRLTSALIGIATVPVGYLALRTMLGRRVGLPTAIITATAFWHVNVTRTGFCWTLRHLVESLVIYFLWRGYREGRLSLLALGGAATGSMLYIYLAARFFPFALVLILLYLLLVDRQRLSRRWLGLLVMTLAALVVFTPLGVHLLRFPYDVWERADEVLAAKRSGDESYLAVIADNALRMGLTFLPRMDSSSRYSLEGRPAFDPLIGPLFVLGGGPGAVSLAAVGMDAVWRWSQGRGRWRPVVPVALCGMPAIEGAYDAAYYSTQRAPSRQTYRRFHSDLVDDGRVGGKQLDGGCRLVMSSAHYHHPAAVTTEPRTADVTWAQGRKTVVMLAWDGREIAYVVPMIDVPLIEPTRELLEGLACGREEYVSSTGETLVAPYRICQPPAREGDGSPLAIYSDEVALWEGEVVADGHSLLPEQGWAPGAYRTATGMYEPITLTRLEMLSPTGERAPGDLYVLDAFDVR